MSTQRNQSECRMSLAMDRDSYLWLKAYAARHRWTMAGAIRALLDDKKAQDRHAESCSQAMREQQLSLNLES